MVRSALAGLDAAPPAPGRSLVGASASLALAQRTDLAPAVRCAAAQDAAQRAQRGLAAGAGGPVQQLQGTLNAARQAAASIPGGCQGVGA
jgi:hypothetical protein